MLVYIDDDEDDLELIQHALAPYSASIDLLLYSSSLEGYHFLQELRLSDKRPCLIVLDINMPGLSGKQLLQQIRSLPEYNQTPITLFSTSALEEDRVFAHHHDADYITKPISHIQMRQIVKKWASSCLIGQEQYLN